MSRQVLTLRKRRITVASCCAYLLDGALHDTGGFRRALGKQGVKFLFADLIAGRLAKRIFAEIAQRLSPLFQDVPEGPFAGLVAYERILRHVLKADQTRSRLGGRAQQFVKLEVQSWILGFASLSPHKGE